MYSPNAKWSWFVDIISFRVVKIVFLFQVFTPAQKTRGGFIPLHGYSPAQCMYHDCCFAFPRSFAVSLCARRICAISWLTRDGSAMTPPLSPELGIWFDVKYKGILGA
jgi:hypothetical protein